MKALGGDFSAHLLSFFQWPACGVILPVHENARLGLDTLQLVIFSHGNVGHRFVQSCLFRELASCGYCVITVTHKDGSADYHP